jgi:predicted flap endonuclease-1-like 5' DNA nuclease
MNTNNKKISVLVLGFFWLLVSAHIFSLLTLNSRAGWEFLAIILGSFALGWIAYYVWYGDAEQAEHIQQTTHNNALVTKEQEAVGQLPVYMPVGKYAVYEENDLQIVEGIGPKIDELFKNAGITTWKELSETSTERMSQILTDAGPRFQFNNPKTWAEQARLAHEGKWKELEVFQSGLIGGL